MSAGSHLRALVDHWNEFGPEHGLGELMDYAEDFLRFGRAVPAFDPDRDPPAGKCNCGVECQDKRDGCRYRKAGEVIRECCNAECGWQGTTDRMLGTIGPLCPECDEVTEPVASVAPQALGARTFALLGLLRDCIEYLQSDPATVGGRPEADRLVKRISAEITSGVDSPDGGKHD